MLKSNVFVKLSYIKQMNHGCHSVRDPCGQWTGTPLSAVLDTYGQWTGTPLSTVHTYHGLSDPRDSFT